MSPVCGSRQRYISWSSSQSSTIASTFFVISALKISRVILSQSQLKRRSQLDTFKNDPSNQLERRFQLDSLLQITFRLESASQHTGTIINMDRSTQITINTLACYSAAFTCLICGHESTTRKRLYNHLRALSHAIPKAKLVSKSKMTTNMSTKLKSDFELFKVNPRAYFAIFPKSKHPRLNTKSKTKSKNKSKNKSLNNKSKNSRIKDELASDIFRMPINVWQCLNK